MMIIDYYEVFERVHPDPLTELFKEFDHALAEKIVFEKRRLEKYEKCYPIIYQHLIDTNPLLKLTMGYLNENKK